MQRLKITDLRFGNTVIDLELKRHLHDGGVNILRKEGEVEVAIVDLREWPRNASERSSRVSAKRGV